jgi:hypothetical protein
MVQINQGKTHKLPSIELLILSQINNANNLTDNLTQDQNLINKIRKEEIEDNQTTHLMMNKTMMAI